ncbi:MAG TPA: hypothetical protein VHX88_19385 [Solirubrobacteraceae bacterium]|jgi:hypothetical protein|nr:hypothetical protein [Solirubrobacteraceae bacterium]
MLSLSTSGRRTAVAGGILIALVSAPLALGFGEGSSIRGGTRNPSTNPSLTYSAQTQIIADNGSWGTRQSNKGTGGAAIYGCRTGSGGAPCLEADNLNAGKAFAFLSSGSTGGSITLSNTSGAPFTTNAKGVATGLNANYLQGHTASDFQLTSQPAANANALGGQAASNYVTTSQVMFADVSAAGALGNTRGATAASLTSATNTYAVTFNTNVSKCSYTASPTGAALSSGQLAVSPNAANVDVVDVAAPAALPSTSGIDLQVIC